MNDDEDDLTLYSFAMWVCRMATIGGVFWTALVWFA